MIARCPCTPPLTVEMFGEKIAPRLVLVRRGGFTEEDDKEDDE